MKKNWLLTAVAAIAVTVSGLDAGAQVRFGVLGGFTSSETKIKNMETSSVSLYHAGVALKVPLMLGFAIQPQVLYQVKGVSLDQAKLSQMQLDTKVGYVEVPVQVQWGPDLLFFRPYIFGEPFVGYALNVESKLEIPSLSTSTTVRDNFEDSFINRLEYGLSLGAGIEIWRLQLSAKYFWNFGSLTTEGRTLLDAFNEAVSENVKSNDSFNGVSVSLALFF